MFAIEFLRIDGRNHTPIHYRIPADQTPAVELGAMLDTMHQMGTPIAQMSAGRYAVHLTEANQVWSVRIVRVNPDLESTQAMPAVTDGMVALYDANREQVRVVTADEYRQMQASSTGG